MTHRRCGALPKDPPHFRSFLSHARLLSGSPGQQAPILFELSDICLRSQPTFADICHATDVPTPSCLRIERVRVFKRGKWGGPGWMDHSYVQLNWDLFNKTRIVKHPFRFFRCWISREVL